MRQLLRDRPDQPDARARANLGQVRLETFSGDRSQYRNWMKTIQAQKQLYQIQDKELAVLLFLSCAGEAREVLNQLEVADTQEEGGLQRILRLLEDAYGSKADERFEERQTAFLNYRRSPGQSIAAYLATLKRLRNEYLHEDPGSVISDRAFAQRMLTRAALTRRERYDCFFAAGGAYRSAPIEKVLRFSLDVQTCTLRRSLRPDVKKDTRGQPDHHRRGDPSKGLIAAHLTEPQGMHMSRTRTTALTMMRTSAKTQMMRIWSRRLWWPKKKCRRKKSGATMRMKPRMTRSRQWIKQPCKRLLQRAVEPRTRRLRLGRTVATATVESPRRGRAKERGLTAESQMTASATAPALHAAKRGIGVVMQFAPTCNQVETLPTRRKVQPTTQQQHRVLARAALSNPEGAAPHRLSELMTDLHCSADTAQRAGKMAKLALLPSTLLQRRRGEMWWTSHQWKLMWRRGAKAKREKPPEPPHPPPEKPKEEKDRSPSRKEPEREPKTSPGEKPKKRRKRSTGEDRSDRARRSSGEHRSDRDRTRARRRVKEEEEATPASTPRGEAEEAFVSQPASGTTARQCNWTLMVGSWDVLKDYDSDGSNTVSSQELESESYLDDLVRKYQFQNTPAPKSAAREKLKVKLMTVLKSLTEEEKDEEVKRRLQKKQDHLRDKITAKAVRSQASGSEAPARTRPRQETRDPKLDEDMGLSTDELLKILPNMSKDEKKMLYKQLKKEREAEALKLFEKDPASSPAKLKRPDRRKDGYSAASMPTSSTGRSLKKEDVEEPPDQEEPIPIGVKKKRMEKFRRQLYEAAMNRKGKVVPSEASDLPNAEQERCSHPYERLLWGANVHAHWANCKDCKLRKVLYYSVMHGAMTANQCSHALNQEQEAYQANVLAPGHVILDTGCRTAVAGRKWHVALQSLMRQKGLPFHKTNHEEVYRFGAGAPVLSTGLPLCSADLRPQVLGAHCGGWQHPRRWPCSRVSWSCGTCWTRTVEGADWLPQVAGCNPWQMAAYSFVAFKASNSQPAERWQAPWPICMGDRRTQRIEAAPHQWPTFLCPLARGTGWSELRWRLRRRARPNYEWSRPLDGISIWNDGPLAKEIRVGNYQPAGRDGSGLLPCHYQQGWRRHLDRLNQWARKRDITWRWTPNGSQQLWRGLHRDGRRLRWRGDDGWQRRRYWVSWKGTEAKTFGCCQEHQWSRGDRAQPLQEGEGDPSSAPAAYRLQDPWDLYLVVHAVTICLWIGLGVSRASDFAWLGSDRP